MSQQHKVTSEVRKPNDVIAEARAKADAQAAATKVDEAKTDNKANNEGKDTKAEAAPKGKKRLNRKQWVEIIAKKNKEGLTSKQIAEEYGVSAGNVDQWSSKLKAEDRKNKESAVTTPKSLADTAKHLLDGIDKELADFDKKVEEAKALVANAKEERAKIEAAKTEYQAIIDKFSDAK